MRKITSNAVAHFLARQEFFASNTSVTVDEDGISALGIFGNEIALLDRAGELKISARLDETGDITTTTKERLNGLPGVGVHVSRHELFLNGKSWDGDWIVIRASETAAA